ncbi:MAG: DUF2914 domain-containing protein [Candidatus Eisenbacteria bacterium]|nr:DUF2914 domain-containing protein [Candidatus Eisenbacteria bacterium]
MAVRAVLFAVLMPVTLCLTPSATADEPSTEEPGAATAPAPPTQPRMVVSPAGLEVLRAYICEDVEERQPVQAGTSFVGDDPGASRLCCFSEIGLPAASDTVLHIWYWGEREMLRIPLEVRAPRWRTWSAKSVSDSWSGAWRVDITDRAGLVLMRLPFSVE